MSDKVYTVEEASNKTGISARSISYYCKRDKVRKKSNRYQITSEMLQKWLSEMSVNGGDFARLQKDFARLREMNENLSKENQNLTEELSQVKDQINSLNDDRDSFQDLSKAYDESLKTLEALHKELEQVREELKNTAKERDSLQNTSKDYNESLKSLEDVSGELKQRKDQIFNLTNERDSLKKQVTDLESNLTKEIPHQDKLRNAIELITLEALRQNVQHKIFTDEEYNDLIGTLSEVDFQKEQVNYLRKRVEKQDEMLTKILQQVSERNYIEVKEKGLYDD